MLAIEGDPVAGYVAVHTLIREPHLCESQKPSQIILNHIPFSRERPKSRTLQMRVVVTKCHAATPELSRLSFNDSESATLQIHTKHDSITQNSMVTFCGVALSEQA
jgi:hypothetical protein